MPEINSPYLSVVQAGEYAHVCKWTIYRWLADGLEHRQRTPKSRILIKPEWLDQYLASDRVKVSPALIEASKRPRFKRIEDSGSGLSAFDPKIIFAKKKAK